MSNVRSRKASQEPCAAGVDLEQFGAVVGPFRARFSPEALSSSVHRDVCILGPCGVVGGTLLPALAARCAAHPHAPAVFV